MNNLLNNRGFSFYNYNIGNNHPVNLLDFITTLEKIIGKEVKKKFMPMQPGDVVETYADISKLEREIGYRPLTSIEEGLKRFVEWYEEYRGRRNEEDRTQD